MKNFSILFSLIVLLSQSALAHVEIGTYQGHTADGKICSLKTVRQYFESNTPHPLNERVIVQIGAEQFTMAHPPVVNAAQSMAFFNHDIFQGVNPTSTGARALVIDMSHEEGKDGPTGFHLIDHQWKSDTRAATHCKDLSFIGLR